MGVWMVVGGTVVGVALVVAGTLAMHRETMEGFATVRTELRGVRLGVQEVQAEVRGGFEEIKSLLSDLESGDAEQ